MFYGSRYSETVLIGKCESCAHWKEVNVGDGMCQAPSEAKTRGADKGKGWRRTLGFRRCEIDQFSRKTSPNQGPVRKG